ncbi:MAG: hypothetical protein ACI308_04090 [Muribaculaceae bacterium]
MKRTLNVIIMSAVAAMAVNAQSWLPQHPNKNVNVRALGCEYSDAKLSKCTELNANSRDWSVSTSPNSELGGTNYTFTALRDMNSVGVAVAIDRYGWNSDNYVMIPAVVYGGNRQRIVNRNYATGLDKSDYYRRDLALTSNPIPQLSPEFGAKSLLEVNVSNTSTPAIAILERLNKKADIIFTDQGIEWQGEVKDHALIIEESADRSIASFVVSAPGVRSRKPEFIGFSKSPDRGVDVKKGDHIVIRIDVCHFAATTTADVLSRFMAERKQHTVVQQPRNLMPMSEVLKRMRVNIDERYFKGPVGEYYCPENADWMSYGWIGGLINTYPMLAAGDGEHLAKVCNTFEFGLKYGPTKSGYFYDLVEKTGKPRFGDASKYVQGIGLVRKNADVLYWMVKQFMLMESMGNGESIKPEWKQTVKQLADAFVNTWRDEGTWGNYINLETGRVAAYNTTGGAMAVGALALASRYYGNDEYMQVAKQVASEYYRDFVVRGFTSGGCGDILQNADSETASALMTSFITMYEATGDAKYLDHSIDLANLSATWTVSFPYVLPQNTDLYKLGANLTGAVWASTQNKHGAPGFCTQSGDALFKIYRATGREEYAELLRDIIHAHAEGIQPNGKITERLTYCDADSRGSRLDGGKTGWNETNGALMAIEVPGMYVRTDLKKAYMFDHLTVEKIETKGKQLRITVNNPTQFDAVLTVLAEDAQQAGRVLGDNAFVNWTQKVTVKKGKSAVVVIK